MKPKRNVQRCMSPRVTQSAGSPNPSGQFHGRSPRPELLCLRKTCKGFCYIGEDSGQSSGVRASCKPLPMWSLAGLPLKIYFKDKWQFWSAAMLLPCLRMHVHAWTWIDRCFLFSRRSDDDSHWTSYRYAEATSFLGISDMCKHCIMPVWTPNSERASTRVDTAGHGQLTSTEDVQTEFCWNTPYSVL